MKKGLYWDRTLGLLFRTNFSCCSAPSGKSFRGASSLMHRHQYKTSFVAAMIFMEYFTWFVVVFFLNGKIFGIWIVNPVLFIFLPAWSKQSLCFHSESVVYGVDHLHRATNYPCGFSHVQFPAHLPADTLIKSWIKICSELFRLLFLL